ncbi:NERD domain-containing protein [Ornithinibacillus sp. L9]|uniref:NERD domain-containing protein n=1 Tax=Ornithinibacillus caprae TaxID=2678566 RepID=A0A6N8FCX9_9BACI|nr:nuclease-related domain-containing protein [Ornithinibacillus caprae]MUK87522.1 NERD domain-containing protein [Ornithinibacillus caprae]
MNLRNRPKPIPLLKLEALIPRLRPGFPYLAELQMEERNRIKGYEGEKKIDYHIRILDKRYTVLHDVYLRVNGKSFQIDTLIISSNAIFIVEMKDYSGKVLLDTVLRQCIHSNGRKENGINYPIAQVENQKLQLENWLVSHNLFDIPVYYFIAFSDSSTIIEVKGDPQEIAPIVAHGEQIPKMVLDKDRELPNKKIQDYKLGKAILRECREYDFDILGKYHVLPHDIMPGVQCPNCGMFGMTRTQKKLAL